MLLKHIIVLIWFSGSLFAHLLLEKILDEQSVSIQTVRPSYVLICIILMNCQCALAKCIVCHCVSTHEII